MKLIFRILILLLLIFGFAYDGMAEENYLFEHLSTEDGLSHGSVSGMLKDRKGFMWFATWDGINQFDGITFKTYKPATGNSTSAASNRIENMQMDALGNIWVSTFDQKLYRLDRFTGTFDILPPPGPAVPEAIVRSIYPASNGDVWLLTESSGLFLVQTDLQTNKFQIQHFNSDSHPALPDNKVMWMSEDSTHLFWIKTAGGMTCFRFHPKTSSYVQHRFPEAIASMIHEQEITQVYQATSALYLGRKDGKILKTETPDQAPAIIDLGVEVPVCALASTNGLLLAGTHGEGVFLLDAVTGEVLLNFRDANIQQVLKFYPDSKGRVWIESSMAGIGMIDPGTRNFKHFNQKLQVPPDIRPNAQCGIMEDGQQTLWLTLKGGGFGYYNESSGEVEYFYNEPGKPESRVSNFVNCFYCDTTGVLWMSTYFGGIEKVSTIKPQFVLTRPAPQSELGIHNEVRALLTDRKGRLWVATKNQELFIYDQQLNIVQKIDHFKGEKIGRVYALFEDRDGKIFAGTKGNGLFILHPGGGLNFRVEHFLNEEGNPYSLSDNNIYSIHEDEQQRIWIGTYGGGVNVMHKGRFYHAGNDFVDYPMAKASRVRHIVGDQYGRIWIGTTMGLLLIEPGDRLPEQFHFRYFDPGKRQLPGLKGIDVLWIYPASNGTLWLASMGGGLAQLLNDPDSTEVLQWKSFTRNDGLSSDVVLTISGNEKGTLWMSTENGIASFQPENKVFRHYNRYDGLTGTGFSEGAVALLSDGRFAMGTSKGFFSFHPDSLSPGLKNIPIEWSSFQLFGKEVVPGVNAVLQKTITETKAVQLKHHQNVIGIGWSALDFTMQDKLQFEYRLKGYDDDWHAVVGQQRVSFNKLPSGEYLLEVRLGNPEHQAMNPPKQLQLEILPPFWKTRPAYFLYTLLLLIVLLLAWRLAASMISLRNKVTVERELNKLKIDFFTNISHELRTPLTLILGPASEIRITEKLSESGKSYLAMIEEHTQRLLTLVNQLLDFRKVQSNKMELSLQAVEVNALLNKVCNGFQPMAHEKDIHLRVTGTDGRLMLLLDEEKMEGVLYNLLSNAMKFTPHGGQIQVKIDVEGEFVLIEVADNGPGIATNQASKLFEVFASSGRGTGIGLALSKAYLTLHGGDLIYYPTPGGGATFRASLKAAGAKVEHIAESKTVMNGHFEKDETVQAMKAEGKLPHLLIADDHPDLRRLLKMQLGTFYEIAEASDGLEAWEMAADQQPDILLSDVMMPRMDGIQLLEKMKNHPDTSHIPVVLLTARSSVESRIEGLKYGADAYLTKPFHPDQLRAQLHNLLVQKDRLRAYFTGQNFVPEILGNEQITSYDAQFLKQVRACILNNLTNSEFKMDDLYREAGMGRSKFSDKLKGLTGLSPIELVMEVRLNKARELLQSGAYNVSETSYLSGFSDAGYFSKCYKEHFGVLPSQEVKK